MQLLVCVRVWLSEPHHWRVAAVLEYTGGLRYIPERSRIRSAESAGSANAENHAGFAVRALRPSCRYRLEGNNDSAGSVGCKDADDCRLVTASIACPRPSCRVTEAQQLFFASLAQRTPQIAGSLPFRIPGLSNVWKRRHVIVGSINVF